MTILLAFPVHQSRLCLYEVTLDLRIEVPSEAGISRCIALDIRVQPNVRECVDLLKGTAAQENIPAVVRMILA